MQPAMRASPAPALPIRATRLRNLGTHAVYGMGLYVAAVVIAGL
jgi:hypothetical protein